MTRVRPYAPADRVAFHALCAEMEAYWSGEDVPGRAVQAARIDQALATLRDMRVLVAEGKGGALAGMLTAQPTWPGASLTLAWWVSEVYVAAAARGQGIGRALMHRFLDDVLTGAPEGTRVDIVTDHDNHAAAALYRATGATENPKLFLRYRMPTTTPADTPTETNEEASHA
ncbi:MAG: GNAT family N-acetyltransferase [Pseudomonadota bacterium]